MKFKVPKCSKRSALLRVSFVSMVAVMLAIVISMPNGITTNVAATWGQNEDYPGVHIEMVYAYSPSSALVYTVSPASPNATVTSGQEINNMYVQVELPVSQLELILPFGFDIEDFETYIRATVIYTSPADIDTPYILEPIPLSYTYFDTGPYGSYWVILLAETNMAYTLTQTGTYSMLITLEYLIPE